MVQTLLGLARPPHPADAADAAAAGALPPGHGADARRRPAGATAAAAGRRGTA